METQKQEDMQEKDFPNRRRPWTAVFLSLVTPGLGQVYCGSIKDGIAVIGVVVMFSMLWTVGIMHPKTPFWSFTLMMWGVIHLATILAAVDAYFRARKVRYDYALKEFNHWAIYLTLAWIAGAGVIGYTAFFKFKMFEAFRIPVNAMAPTIMGGDRAIANKMAYDHQQPKYGDVVLFKNPENRKQSNIKRVVALGGDTVEIKNGRLLINGQMLAREWVEKKTLRMNKQIEGDIFWERNGDSRYQIFVSEQTSDAKTTVKDFGPVTVPSHHCFVMADNRNHPADSRQFGALSLGALKGKFTQIYWPLQRRATLDARQE
ncbi:MAG: signal peptidase I [Planctomycetota bacterium]|jgi:signal peptidase I